MAVKYSCDRCRETVKCEVDFICFRIEKRLQNGEGASTAHCVDVCKSCADTLWNTTGENMHNET